MNRIILCCAVAALVAGCSTPVKLDPTPVEDKSGVAVTQGARAQPPDSTVALPASIRSTSRNQSKRSRFSLRNSRSFGREPRSRFTGRLD